MKQSKDRKIIHINDHWAFEGDQLSITLYEKKINKKGKLDYYARGYFNNLQQVFNRLIDMEINSAASLEFIVSQIRDLKQDIFRSLDNLRAKYSDEKVIKDLFSRPGLKDPENARM